MFTGKHEGNAATGLFIQFFDGAFKKRLGLERAGRNQAAESLLVALPGFDIYDGGNAPSVFGIEASGKYVDAPYGLGFKYGEKADGVKGIVNRHPVDHDPVLHGRAAPYVELPTLIAGNDDTGKHRQILRNIGLSAGGGQGADLLGGYLQGGNGGFRTRPLPAPRDFDRGEFHGIGFQKYALKRDFVFFHFNSHNGRVVPQVSHYQLVLPYRHVGNREEAIQVGIGAEIRTPDQYVGKGYGFAGVFIQHRTTKGSLLGPYRRRKAQCRKEEQQKVEFAHSGLWIF